MSRLLVRLIINAIALAVIIQLDFLGIDFDGGWQGLLILAAIFGLVNAIIRPIVTVFSFPLLLVTLGLFTIVINMAMLVITAAIGGALGYQLEFDGFLSVLLGSIVISLVSWVLSALLR